MLTKKNIGITCFIIIVIVSSATILFYTPKTADQKEVKVYVDKLFSFSGKLTPAEKKDFLATVFALEKLTGNLKDQSEMDRLISPADFEVLLEHTQKVIRENPEIKPPAHSHIHEQGHEEVYQQEQIKKDELAKINAAIEALKASDAAEGAKEALLSVFEHRRAVLLDSGKTARKMEKLLEEIMKTEPDVVAIDWGPNGYKKIYDHHLEIEKERRHYPDGTVEEYYTSSHFGSSDRKLNNALTEYVETLKRTPPWKPHPPPPEHKDLHYFLEYKDVYVDEEGKRRSNSLPPIKEQKNNVLSDGMADNPSDDVLPDVPMDNPLEEIPSDNSQKDPDLMITQEEVDAWRLSIGTLETNEIEEIRSIFERGIGIPLDRFLEMSDAEIEAEFQKQFNSSPDARIVEDFEELITPSVIGATEHPTVDFEKKIRSKYSQLRFDRAMATLNYHGPEEGLRRLQEIDPEVAADIKRFLQKQQEK